MIVSVTERGTFRRCHLQWQLTAKNGRHLTPISSKPYLNIGTLVHAGGEAWLNDPRFGYAHHVKAAGIAMEDSVRARYRKIVGAPISEVEMQPFLDSINFAAAMAHNYQVRWGTPLPEGFICIQPEQKIQIPIPGTDHDCENCHGKGEVWHKQDFEVLGTGWGPCADCLGSGKIHHFLEGRLDGLLQRKADGSIWVLERKTYGQRPKIETLEFSDQFIAYLWMLRQLGIAQVGGIAYDGLWSRDVPPKGRTMEDLFLRLLLTRSNQELDIFEEHLRAEVNLMAHVQASGVFIPNRQWMGCYDCSVSRICDAKLRGEPTENIIRLHYMEREDDVDQPTEEDAA